MRRGRRKARGGDALSWLPARQVARLKNTTGRGGLGKKGGRAGDGKRPRPRLKPQTKAGGETRKADGVWAGSGGLDSGEGPPRGAGGARGGGKGSGAPRAGRGGGESPTGGTLEQTPHEKTKTRRGGGFFSRGPKTFRQGPRLFGPGGGGPSPRGRAFWGVRRGGGRKFGDMSKQGGGGGGPGKKNFFFKGGLGALGRGKSGGGRGKFFPGDGGGKGGASPKSPDGGGSFFNLAGGTKTKKTKNFAVFGFVARTKTKVFHSFSKRGGGGEKRGIFGGAAGGRGRVEGSGFPGGGGGRGGPGGKKKGGGGGGAPPKRVGGKNLVNFIVRPHEKAFKQTHKKRDDSGGGGTGHPRRARGKGAWNGGGGGAGGTNGPTDQGGGSTKRLSGTFGRPTGHALWGKGGGGGPISLFWVGQSAGETGSPPWPADFRARGARGKKAGEETEGRMPKITPGPRCMGGGTGEPRGGGRGAVWEGPGAATEISFDKKAPGGGPWGQPGGVGPRLGGAICNEGKDQKPFRGGRAVVFQPPRSKKKKPGGGGPGGGGGAREILPPQPPEWVWRGFFRRRGKILQGALCFSHRRKRAVVECRVRGWGAQGG